MSTPCPPRSPFAVLPSLAARFAALALACGLALIPVAAAAQSGSITTLSVPPAQVTLPRGGLWEPAPAPPGEARATVDLSRSHRLIASLRVIPVTEPAAVTALLKRPRDHLAEVLMGMGDSVAGMLDVPLSGEVLFDGSPITVGPLWCLYYNALADGVPFDATAGSSRVVDAAGALCAVYDPPMVVDVRLTSRRRGPVDPYRDLAMDADAMWQTLTLR